MKNGLVTPTLGSSVLVALLSFVAVSQVAVSRSNGQGPPDLSGLTAEEQAMVARACNVDRQFHGPAKYYGCLRDQLVALRTSAGEPDLSGLTTEEQAMVARACNVDRQFHGPAKYYGCLRTQLVALGVSIAPRRAAPTSPPQLVPTNPETPSNLHGETPDSGPSAPSSPRKQPRRSAESGIVLTKPEAQSHKEMVPASPHRVVATSPETPSKPQPEKPDWGPFVPKILGLALLLYLIRLGYVRLKTGKCTGCGVRTANATRVCHSCQARLNAAETRRQEEQRREAQRQAEDTRRREAEARAEQRRRQEEQDRQKVRTLEDLQRLSGSDFERLIASLFVKDGYRVSPRGGSGDEGIDLILNVGNSKDVVQCKRWKADIGSPIIREFYGSMMHVGARRGFVITTASFTQSARDFAIGKPITLIDGEYLIAWINGTRSGQQAAAGQSSESDFNPYEVLGVSRGASKDEIRSAYVSLIAKYHPDKVSHLGYEFQAIAREKALAINRAYEMLTNP